MFMKNVMVKTKILTQEIQSVQINIIDTLEAAQATIATLQHMRDDSNGNQNFMKRVVRNDNADT